VVTFEVKFRDLLQQFAPSLQIGCGATSGCLERFAPPLTLTFIVVEIFV